MRTSGRVLIFLQFSGNHFCVIFVISDTLRTRVTDAVFKKKERPRLDQDTNHFFSVPPRPPGPDSMEHNEGGDVPDDNLDDGDDEDNHVSASPSVRQIVRQRQRKGAAVNEGDKEGQERNTVNETYDSPSGVLKV